jgi:hypothetical protein
MAQVVNPAVLGVAGSDIDGSDIPWAMWIKANAVPLDLLANTGILGNTSTQLGYGATLPFTPAAPAELLSTVVVLGAADGTLYAPAGETPKPADLSTAAGLLDAAGQHFYAPAGVVPMAADMSATAFLIDAAATLFYGPQGSEPTLIDPGTIVGLIDSTGPTYFAASPSIPANPGTPTLVLSVERGAFATPGSIPQ